jgi:hypothetical protein
LIVVDKTAPGCSRYQCGRSVPPPEKLTRNGDRDRTIESPRVDRGRDDRARIVRVISIIVIAVASETKSRQKTRRLNSGSQIF